MPTLSIEVKREQKMFGETFQWAVKDVLLSKHPSKIPADPSMIVDNNSHQDSFHPVIFDKITGALIRKVATRMSGAAGPSSADARDWRRYCCSFQRYSDDLCDSLASVARKLCTTLVDPKGLEAFVAGRLIALNKKPGVRPIGVGEVCRRIVGKAVLSVISFDIQEAAGFLKLCGGQFAGCEAAVHAVRSMFQEEDTQGILLADASNAFNSLNRDVALINTCHLCPSLSNILINTYRSDVPLFIDSEVIWSREGTTQGDPLAMPMFAIGVVPLIRHLHCTACQVWYADDSAAAGSLLELHQWWDRLNQLRHKFGYFVKSKKTHLLSEAQLIFRGTGVTISCGGQRYLGSVIGEESYIEDYVRERVEVWKNELLQLIHIAESQPHAAFACFVHGFSSK